MIIVETPYIILILYMVLILPIFFKYHQIITNILGRWKLLLKGESAVEQGIDRRNINIDIISFTTLIKPYTAHN